MMNTTHFRYALGTVLVLATSADLVLERLQDEKDERERPKQDEGDELAGLARVAHGIVEAGPCIGRSEFLKDGEVVEGMYYVRYRAGDGRQREDWFTPDAVTTLEAIEAEFEREQDTSEAARREPPVEPEPPVAAEPSFATELTGERAPDGC